MRIKNYKILCFFLILFVICSGICFESIKTDSIFACAPIETSNVQSISFGEAASDAEVCTTEMLGIRNHSRIQQLTEQGIPRGVEKLSLVLLCLYLFSILLRKFFKSSEKVQFLEVHQEETVSNYIHKTDGKKRI